MRLRKKHGGCSIAGHEWPEDGAVAEVPDELGAELLALAPDEYEHLLDDAPVEEEEGSGGSIPPLQAGDDLILVRTDGSSSPEQPAEPEQPAQASRGQQPRNRRR